ncbi:hypothetical protein MKW98_019208 [Papaver atlanticum]|uniref:FAD-binding PCMH-type domain-containing protein n=1 Tax=Papaver atlanticum TaxID=357466 RepID=A0AAD4TBN0_9MAGN|nr:hypothetical protein MKW98_019208 [Papaver atlanticum]
MTIEQENQNQSKMDSSTYLPLSLSLLYLVSWINTTTSSSSATLLSTENNFLRCMSLQFSSFSQIHTPKTSSYASLLYSNTTSYRRFYSTTKPKPLAILTPKNEADIKKAFICSKKNGFQVRVKSGGHDYEGLSSISNFPFIIVDLVNFRSISVNVKCETAWVQAGATIGELYYRIAEKSKTLAFPAGTCPTVGVGGHFSGGGMGTLVRKYGVAADNVIDAYILDANSIILNRKSMGENLFWAIRGGSGASFGIILSWKVKLVSVPPTVTVFTPRRSLEKGAAQLVLRWQHIADKLHEDLYIRVILQNGLDEQTGNKTIYALFNSLYLGGTQELLQLMEQSFPELGVTASECTEMSWIESVLYFVNVQEKPLEVLLDRTHSDTEFFKAKSDFVNKPISEIGFQGYGEVSKKKIGIMSKISESSVPFPHRKGNLYNIQYIVKWKQEGIQASQNHMKWMKDLYEYTTPFVTNSPRAAYVNYRDLDLGTNDLCNMNYSQSSQWGMKYFKGNFKRCAWVKRETDPRNFFRNEQSIPPFQKEKQSMVISLAPAKEKQSMANFLLLLLSFFFF